MKYKGMPLLPLLTAAAATAVFVQYRLSMRTAHERLRGKSTVIPSPYGNIEYTEHGAGSNVLVIHGSGGGFDQGELLAHIVLDDQFHCIIPSRFGYLQSTFHEDATWDDQAHAYAHLLDQLQHSKGWGRRLLRGRSISPPVRAVAPRASVVAHADLLRRCPDPSARGQAGAKARQRTALDLPDGLPVLGYKPAVQAAIHEAHRGTQGCRGQTQTRTIQGDRSLHRLDEPGFAAVRRRGL